MAHVSLVKTQQGFFPADTETEQLMQKFGAGEILHGDFKKMRNPRFHRKFFAMLKIGFQMWEPGEFQHKGQSIKAEPNFESFREWVTIQAGFYTVRGYPDGSARAAPKSISFAKMDDIEFQDVYSKVLDVILKHVCPDFDRDDYEHSVEQILGFA